MDDYNFFIIGAGFTKAVSEDAPLNDKLLDALIDKNPSSPLNKLRKSYETSDIELLLTMLDIDILNKKYDNDIRNEINNEIASFFQKYRFKPEILGDKVWLEKFAKNTFTENDIIVNLNYECFLEGLLDWYGVWHPINGYDIIDNPLINKPINPKNIQILKIHGSEHFTQQPVGDKPECLSVTFEFNENIFPKSAQNCGLGPRSIPKPNKHAGPYIIAPSYIKNPCVEISRLMAVALESVKNAKNMIIIGCSLRPEDNFLWLILTSFLDQNESINKKILVIDPEADELCDKISKYFVVNSVASVIKKNPPKKLEEADDILNILNSKSE